MLDNAQAFSQEIMGSELLVREEKGVFDGAKVAALEASSLASRYDPGSLGFQYEVSIIDKSEYANAMDFTQNAFTSPPPENADVYSISRPINIWVSGSEVHQGMLVVSIWR